MRSPVRYIVLALLVLLFLAGPSLLRFYTDWLWFEEVGYQNVFLTMLRSQGTLFTITFVLATAWLASNLNVSLRAIGNMRPCSRHVKASRSRCLEDGNSAHWRSAPPCSSRR